MDKEISKKRNLKQYFSEELLMPILKSIPVIAVIVLVPLFLNGDSGTRILLGFIIGGIAVLGLLVLFAIHNKRNMKWVIVIILSIIALSAGVWTAIGVLILGCFIIGILSTNKD